MINEFLKLISSICEKNIRTVFIRAFGYTPKFIIKRLPKNRLGDKVYALHNFAKVHKRFPENNKFNDKLYKIKTTKEIYDPLRVFVTDKEYVKLYIKAIVGDQYNVPTLDILRSEADIDNFTPNQNCVIKPTHSTGKHIFHENGTPIDKAIMKNWLRHNYYIKSREANYKYLNPKIIIEPMLFDKKMAIDYKVFCVNGKPKMIKVDFDRHIEHLRKFYDIHWNPLPFSWNSPPTNKTLQKPKKLNEMLDVASSLSEKFSFVRVDFYIIDKHIYVGEITNCDGGAKNVFYPKSGEQMATDICFNASESA